MSDHVKVAFWSEKLTHDLCDLGLECLHPLCKFFRPKLLNNQEAGVEHLLSHVQDFIQHVI